MITNSRGTPFWGKPTPFITPGDVFPEIPFSAAAHPVQLVKKSPISPKAGYRTNYNVYIFPDEASRLQVDPSKQGQHDLLAQGRITKAMFLSWGSEVEDDLRSIAQSGRTGGKTWIAAPIYQVSELPTDRTFAAPETEAFVSMREIVMSNRTHHCFYLKPLPNAPSDDLGWYVDFRRIGAVRVDHFIAQKDRRLATLMGDTRSELFQQLLLFFTRARLFFGPIMCDKCGTPLNLDMPIEDQNEEAEPWTEP